MSDRGKNCYNYKISNLIEQINENKLDFDWLYRKRNRSLMCSEFVTEPYRRCVPDYIVDTDIRFPFEKELNPSKWELVYKK